MSLDAATPEYRLARKIKPVTSEQTTTFDLSASFKAYDVRGIVGESITAEIVEAVGAAFVDVLQLEGETILVGGDMRPSSPNSARPSPTAHQPAAQMSSCWT